jgi:hypothetical protein
VGLRAGMDGFRTLGRLARRELLYQLRYPGNIRFVYNIKYRIAVAARSKASVCGRSLTGIVGSNPSGGMDVCLL